MDIMAHIMMAYDRNDHENAGSLALLCNFPLHTLWSFDVAIEKCLFKVVIIELNGSTGHGFHGFHGS